MALPEPALDFAASPAQVFRRLMARVREGLRQVPLHAVLFITLTVFSAVPVLVAGIWQEETETQDQLRSAAEDDLLVARNLANAVQQYASQAEGLFSATLVVGGLEVASPRINELLASLQFEHVASIAPDGGISSYFLASDWSPDALKPVIPVLRAAAAKAGAKSVFTGFFGPEEKPVFYIVKTLRDARIGVATLSAKYVLELQGSVAFGDHGSAVMVDAAGRLLPAVRNGAFAQQDLAAMLKAPNPMRIFRSRALGTDVLAAGVPVPETGWSVVVSQSIAGVYAKNSQVRLVMLGLAGATLAAAALISWFVAKMLSRPLWRVAEVARTIAAGHWGARVSSVGRAVPNEVRTLAAAFNQMIEAVEHKNKALAMALDDAQAADRAKSRFLATMNHELRTPLNAIIGFSEVMKTEALGPLSRQEYLRYAEGINQSGTHLLDIINDVLELANGGAAALRLHEHEVEPRKILSAALQVIQHRAESAGVALEAAIPDGLEIMRGDGVRLKQMVLNLLSNAVKFTPAGGRVTLWASQTPDRLRIGVRDTGIGIPPAMQDAVFQPFVQVDGSLARKYEGTGLGLPLVKMIAELHGGTVSLQSELSVGTEIVVELPRRRMPSGAEPAAEEAVAA